MIPTTVIASHSTESATIFWLDSFRHPGDNARQRKFGERTRVRDATIYQLADYRAAADNDDWPGT